MSSAHDAQVAFYLTGQPAEAALQPVAPLGLRPALFSGRRDLTALRYDFPLVLLPGRDDSSAVQSLSAIIDCVLAANADSADADRLRQHAYALEQEMRRLLARQGGSARLGAVRAAAVEQLGGPGDRALAASLRALAPALPNDAELADCTRATPARVVAHLWTAAQRVRLAAMRGKIERLTQKVTDILDAAQARSEAGHTPEALRAAIGSAHAGVFDFAAFSRILGRGAPAPGLPDSRRRRLNWLLSVLQGQRFFPGAETDDSRPAYLFCFATCFDALRAWRERLPKALELMKALAIAELEITGEYDEARHDAIFARFGERGPDAADIARFPGYLVLQNTAQMTPADFALALEALDAGLPLKLLLQTDDILAPASLGDGACSFGIANRQLAGAALASGNVFVLQASAAQLFRCRDRLFSGLAAAGPALLSVYSGAGGDTDAVPPYLLAAAATESRAFPSFTYDPSAGEDLASRFSLDGNPQPECDWPLHDLTWQDAGCQRVQQAIAFTAVDLLACDRRFAADVARVASADCSEDMVPVAEYLSHPGGGSALPYLVMFDADDRLHRVVADERLIRAALRCLGLWHGLQEQGGIRNSHAQRALAQARAAWEEAARQQQSPAPTTAAAAAEAPAAAPAPAEPAAAEPERSPDEAYIETARCSSCDECTHINSKMFAYNKDKQAYIADAAAGPYRHLVEAAESCQMAIVHPGKPRDPNEPGLEDLLARAAAFR